MLIIFFILGLIIGSFLNVLAYRLHTAEELFLDRSHCPHCKKQIRWYDNIPVISFILLKSRCRDCKEKISWQYPIVEIFTGVIFALISWKFFVLTDSASWISTAYFLFASSALITILVYDFLYMEIPGSVLWTGIFVSIAFVLFSQGSTLGNPKVEPWAGDVYSSVLAAFLAFVFFFLLSVGSKEKWMGMGDAYLVIFLGLILGFPEILLALFLAFFFGAVYGIIMLALKKKKMKSQVPFAPFLVLGTFVALLFYTPIIDWYFSLFY
ncbi:MAG TPA: prepilin peptidase [Candidatus Moranbacteria bacterium]|nr:prepilin peptidase [Candidatus Moranbacteria bacterium]